MQIPPGFGGAAQQEWTAVRWGWKGGRLLWRSWESQMANEWPPGKSRLLMLLERGKASDVSWEKGRRHQGISQ